MFGVSAVSFTPVSVAREDTDTSASENSTPEGATSGREGIPPAASPPPGAPPVAESAAEKATHRGESEEEQEGQQGKWKTEIHGYFRAPLTLGISSRPNTDEQNQLDPNDPSGQTFLPNGPSHLQLTYGPNRVVDWSYYSFAYTGLQEQDWAELFVHQKKKHVEAVVGWLGYWYGAIGYRNPDASWWPGLAYLTLDTDFEMGGIKPNIALTMGAFWPKFGYVEKYDTYTLGRFRMLGEQLKVTIPLNDDFTVLVFQGFGANRDGAYNFTLQNTNPLYAGKTGVDLITFGHIQVSYQKLVDVGLHYNYEFTRDPTISALGSKSDGKIFSEARKAHLSVAGAEINVRLPYMGRLWLSPSYISVKNGWALAGAGGTEVMHSQNGGGVAENYLALTNSMANSTGSGTLLNLGFLYENWLSNIIPDTGLPEIKLSFFGLVTKTTFDLPPVKEGTPLWVTQTGLTQIKYGLDLTVQAADWLGTMVRWDTVMYNYNPTLRPLEDIARSNSKSLDDYIASDDYQELKRRTFGGYIFSALTARLSLYSHYLSGECVFLQFSRYFYGDNMILAAVWPWNTPLVAGADVFQGNGGYSKQKPDEYVLKLQAQVRF